MPAAPPTRLLAEGSPLGVRSLRLRCPDIVRKAVAQVAVVLPAAPRQESWPGSKASLGPQPSSNPSRGGEPGRPLDCDAVTHPSLGLPPPSFSAGFPAAA